VVRVQRDAPAVIAGAIGGWVERAISQRRT
jgi:hypothetical protein